MKIPWTFAIAPGRPEITPARVGIKPRQGRPGESPGYHGDMGAAAGMPRGESGGSSMTGVTVIVGLGIGAAIGPAAWRAQAASAWAALACAAVRLFWEASSWADWLPWQLQLPPLVLIFFQDFQERLRQVQQSTAVPHAGNGAAATTKSSKRKQVYTYQHTSCCCFM